jgi:hypothetical protein
MPTQMRVEKRSTRTFNNCGDSAATVMQRVEGVAAEALGATIGT